MHFHLAASLAPQNGINTSAICQRVGGAFYGYTRMIVLRAEISQPIEIHTHTHTPICKFINANSIITDAIITVPLCAPSQQCGNSHSFSAGTTLYGVPLCAFRLRCCAVNNRWFGLFSFFMLLLLLLFCKSLRCMLDVPPVD